jgi:hypothetical protein
VVDPEMRQEQKEDEALKMIKAFMSLRERKVTDEDQLRIGTSEAEGIMEEGENGMGERKGRQRPMSKEILEVLRGEDQGEEVTNQSFDSNAAVFQRENTMIHLSLKIHWVNMLQDLDL